ncbi:MAG: DUF5666 domain-containing protein [Bdellovibrio bacteriovorus]
MRKPLIAAMILSSCGLAAPFGIQADYDFYGIVESRPADGHVGDWVIGGRTFTATAQTRIDADDGPVAVGACVSVDMEGAVVEEIESESPDECARAAPAR